MISPVVTPAQARSLVGAVFADVRWYLDGRSGRSAWLSGHLPGAVFVDPQGEAFARQLATNKRAVHCCRSTGLVRL